MADTLKNDAKKALLAPHARPWLALVGEVPATFAAHLAWGDQPLVAGGMTLASCALTAATWWAGKDTSPQRRTHATATTAAATGYLTYASFTNPFGMAQLTWLALGGGTVAASWNIRKAMRVNPEVSKDGGAETGILTKSLGKAKAALRSQPKVEPNKVTAPLKLNEMTTDEVGNRLKAVAVELGVSPNSLRLLNDPENAAYTDLVITPEDMLKKSQRWPGPTNGGGSITDPITIGVYQDGAAAQLWFPAYEPSKMSKEQGRNATHFLAAGMNGSAKSTGVSVAMAEALTRRDVIVWGVDPSKGMQTFAPFLPHMDWVEVTKSGGDDMIDALSQVITARADALGRHGYKNWTPQAFDELGMPYMIVWIEEAAKFFREGTEMEGLVMEARSAGISVIISLQRPSSTSMPTDVREQLGGVICFGVKGSTTADMALPEDVRDAGARPEAWENRKPGYAYLVAPGVPEDRYAIPLRTFLIDDEQISDALAAAPRVHADPVTAAAAGEAYENRTRYDINTPLTSINTEVVMSKKDQADREEALLERQVDRDVDARLGDDGEDNDVSGIDPDEEIPAVEPGQVWQFAEADNSPEKTPEQAMRELLTMLDEYREQGLDEVGPRHFQPYGREGRIGRSRAWISEKLNDLADEEIHLQDTDDAGTYKLLYPEMAAA